MTVWFCPTATGESSGGEASAAQPPSQPQSLKCDEYVYIISIIIVSDIICFCDTSCSCGKLLKSEIDAQVYVCVCVFVLLESVSHCSFGNILMFLVCHIMAVCVCVCVLCRPMQLGRVMQTSQSLLRPSNLSLRRKRRPSLPSELLQVNSLLYITGQLADWRRE